MKGMGIAVVVFAFSLLFGGCEVPVRSIPSGEYFAALIDSSDLDDAESLLNIVLTVDREDRSVTFLLEDGTEVASEVSFRRYRNGCTMDGCIEQEALDILNDPLILEELVFFDPHLKPSNQSPISSDVGALLVSGESEERENSIWFSPHECGICVPEANCDDGHDGDGDLLIDCDDPDCFDAPRCQ